MNEVEVINIFKRYIDKKTESDKEFLFSAAIWSHLVHSCPGLNCTCKAKYKTVRNR